MGAKTPAGCKPGAGPDAGGFRESLDLRKAGVKRVMPCCSMETGP
jgi:hypothetical protein